jgi:hypothetical protein
MNGYIPLSMYLAGCLHLPFSRAPLGISALALSDVPCALRRLLSDLTKSESPDVDREFNLTRFFTGPRPGPLAPRVLNPDTDPQRERTKSTCQTWRLAIQCASAKTAGICDITYARVKKFVDGVSLKLLGE